MEQLIAFVQDEVWFSWVTAIIAVASTIAAATPTPKKGTVLAYVYWVVDFLAINFAKAKDTGEDTGEE